MLSRRLLRIKVVKALYAHFKSESVSEAATMKDLKNSIDSTYNLYLQMLWLPVEIARYAGERIEIGRKKMLPSREDLNPNTRFIDNPIVRRIAESQQLQGMLKTRKLGWREYPELVKGLYGLLAQSDYYKKYMDAESSGWQADVRVLEDFCIRTAQDNDALEQAVEDQSILWADDVDFALGMVVRTLAGMRQGHELSLLPQFNNADDERFAPQLLRATLACWDESRELVDKFTRNWDMERLAFTDSLIMAAAIAELRDFPSIPVKVTLDEFIEIAKFYSTPGSSTFVNGVLDKAVEHLDIKKEGRGLL